MARTGDVEDLGDGAQDADAERADVDEAGDDDEGAEGTRPEAVDPAEGGDRVADHGENDQAGGKGVRTGRRWPLADAQLHDIPRVVAHVGDAAECGLYDGVDGVESAEEEVEQGGEMFGL